MSEKKESPFIDLNLENRVLRSLIADGTKDRENFNEISGNISLISNSDIIKEFFNTPFRQWLFQKILNYYEEHSDCLSSSVILREMRKHFRKQSLFDSKKVILDKILNLDFDPKTFKPSLKSLKNNFHYNSLYETTKEAVDELKDHYETGEENAIEIARKMEDVTSKIIISNDNVRILEEDIFDNIDNHIDLIKDKKKKPEKYRGITTGFSEIDQATGGWINGEFSLILGRPGMGKSILLTNFAYTAFKKNYNVIYITIEMPLEQQKNRFYSLLTGIEYNKIKFPTNLTEPEMEKLEKKIRESEEEHSNYFWTIDSPENCSAAFLESRIMSFQNNKNQKAHLLIVDPIYLMTPSNKKVDDPVGQISWDLKILARKMNIPVLAASQFNREAHKRHNKEKRVDTMDAAFSDKLGQNTDNMLGLVGPLPKEDPGAILYFPKTRDSDITNFDIYREFHIMKISKDIRTEEEKKESKKKDKK